MKHKPPPKAHGPPIEAFSIYDDLPTPGRDDYLIDSDCWAEAYLQKDPTPGKAVSYARIGQKLQPQRKKSPLTTKSAFDSWILIVCAQCPFPYAGLKLKPILNHESSICPH